ncbi:MAG: hypothetical protein ACREHD_05240 [Pirellulales bacterium]
MMRRLARAMQIAALVLLPLSMILQLAHAVTEGQMLMAMVAGICLFGIGRILQGLGT